MTEGFQYRRNWTRARNSVTCRCSHSTLLPSRRRDQERRPGLGAGVPMGLASVGRGKGFRPPSSRSSSRWCRSVDIEPCAGRTAVGPHIERSRRGGKSRGTGAEKRPKMRGRGHAKSNLLRPSGGIRQGAARHQNQCHRPADQDCAAEPTHDAAS
jgi:hypothetical protein